MQNTRNRVAVWVAALAVAALLLADCAPGLAAESRPLAPIAPIATDDGDDGVILLAQAQRKKRRTLMDFLFGDDEDEPAPVVEKPVRKKSTEAKPVIAAPAKPAIEKAPGATRLAVFGDSMATDIGRALERLFEEDPNLAILTQGVGSSGFVRNDFFDWPAEIGKQLATDAFDIAVIIVGINDRQNIGKAKPLTPEWSAEYTARVSGVVQALRTANKPAIWIGLPPMSKSEYSKALQQITEIQKLAAFSGGAEFLEIFDRFVDEDGNYSSHGPDINGNRVRMRKDDGIHFSAAGADKVAFYLSQTLKTYYRGGGTVGIQVADPLLGTDAQLMLRPPYQGIGQMRLLEVAGAVISLNRAPRRAADLVVREATALPEDGPARPFDPALLVQAPEGRADAFWVGIKPAQDVAEVR